MPLVIICGYPCSGKSTRCGQLEEFLRDKLQKEVHVVKDRISGQEKNQLYADSRNEKDARGALKAEAHRLLTRENVVIIDSLNYIKGFRYELFCMSKSSNTTQCVIHCDTNKEVCKKWNSELPESDRYCEKIFDELVMRFETPNPQQRWDSPLFEIQVDDELPWKQLDDALFQRKAPPPNLSTQSQPLSSTNFLYELDKITQDIVTTVMEEQKSKVAGEFISIPGAKDKLEVIRTLTLMELQRLKRQFIKYTKMHPVEDVTKLPNLFVQYLQNSIK